jgi:hypothetical protein
MELDPKNQASFLLVLMPASLAMLLLIENVHGKINLWEYIYENIHGRDLVITAWPGLTHADAERIVCLSNPYLHYV